jgi:hypothetical protein
VSWLFEDPTMLIAAGVLIEALLAVALVKSGRASLVGAMAGVLLLVALGIVVEQMVVTEREQIEVVLDDAAAALVAGDVARVLRSIDPAAAELRSYVQSVMSHARITEAKLNDLRITINRHTAPPTARADFMGRVKGTFGRGAASGGEGLALRRLTVDLRRDPTGWLITEYRDRGPPVGQPRE